MREKLKITEGIFPMPVLMIATYNEDGSVNVMNAAWGTMQERGTVALNLTESHKTVKNIKARGAFTVSIADAAHLVEADYFGVESGNNVPDKFARSGLTASRAETVDAPVINEFPLCLNVLDNLPLLHLIRALSELVLFSLQFFMQHLLNWIRAMFQGKRYLNAWVIEIICQNSNVVN